MGKGDQKSRRGKINAGSYGKKRPKKSSAAIPVKVLVEKPAKTKKEDAAEVVEKVEKPKRVVKPKEESTEEKPKTNRKKKTEE